MLRERLRKKLQTNHPSRIEDSDRIRAAVLIPFFDHDGTEYLVFTKRTDFVATHRGEICFPGGMMENADPDLRTTSLREMEEELSVSPQQVEVLGSLDELRTVSSNFLIVPYVGYLKQKVQFIRNQQEVSQVLEIPFEHFLNPEIFHEESRIVEGHALTVYFYRWESHMIWGVTGRILKSLLDLLKEE